ncbi:hypothetical protein FOQG_15266 [Fusarium oxysporum f. sp. raphani 54005]|uniref:Zn(2)-C6 fungal-type domain-containing protein n=1 Tax=Fusarium oxysporum f. sp. raphani 54005 TaxID=1089458 RepID=X0BEH0_FUSOX|nr:hypothetical protein FOQG_15266 [Fusarium oxysporum f. sp. raphani 54005]
MQRRSAGTQRQRVLQACDFCHSRGLKCRRSSMTETTSRDGHRTCLTCIDYGAECTMNRPVRKRGRKPAVTTGKSNKQKQTGSESSDFRSPQCIRRLIDIYRDTMYQCYFPFLSENDLERRWADSIPGDSETAYLLLMALCALSAQSLTLKAVFDSTLLGNVVSHDSDIYFNEAVSHIPARIPDTPDLDYLRSFGLLAVYLLRSGSKSDLHRYLGLCHAWIAQHGFNMENNWDSSISLLEVDDRRRLFWCVYRLEIHSACVLGHIIRLPEAQVSVLYPRITPAMSRETQAWTAGWDYITDLFRLMEYAILNLRQRKPHRDVVAVFCDRPSPRALLDSLDQLKASKPFILRVLSQSHDDFQSNRCKFMAVQITCTEALVNIMGLLHCQAPVDEVIKVAEDFLNEITEASLIMFKVASSQIVHQLLGVGHMVYNAFLYDENQSQFAVGRLVTYLEDIVKNLEQDIPTATEAREQLRKLAKCII